MNTRYYILQFYINCDQCLDVFVAGNKREQGLYTSILFVYHVYYF
jgi:hypothetical protein